MAEVKHDVSEAIKKSITRKISERERLVYAVDKVHRETIVDGIRKDVTRLREREEIDIPLESLMSIAMKYLKEYEVPDLNLSEGEVFVMSVECQGDGSGNFADTYYPSLYLYSSYELLRKAIKKHLEENGKAADKKSIFKYVHKGGYILGENDWVRIYKLKLNAKYEQRDNDYPHLSSYDYYDDLSK